MIFLRKFNVLFFINYGRSASGQYVRPTNHEIAGLMPSTLQRFLSGLSFWNEVRPSSLRKIS